MRRSRLPFLAVALLLVLAACAGGGDAPAVAGEPQRVENESLGIAVVIPPGSPFELVANEGDEIRLHYSGDGEYAAGEVVYSAFPVQDYGVNLYDAVNRRKEEIEARAEGQFFGQGELGSHLGAAFNTRGRYRGEGGEEVEELRIFAVHPTVNRILHMTYRYPPAPGQTQARMMDQAFVAFGYVEPLAGAEGEAPAGDGERGGG